MIDNSPKPPTNRLSNTPKVIKSAKNIIVMDKGKRVVLAKALEEPEAKKDFPVCLTIVKNSILFLDKLAMEQLTLSYSKESQKMRIFFA